MFSSRPCRTGVFDVFDGIDVFDQMSFRHDAHLQDSFPGLFSNWLHTFFFIPSQTPYNVHVHERTRTYTRIHTHSRAHTCTYAQSNFSVPGSASNSPRHGSMDRPTNPIIQTAIDRDSLECSFSSDEAVRSDQRLINYFSTSRRDVGG